MNLTDARAHRRHACRSKARHGCACWSALGSGGAVHQFIDFRTGQIRRGKLIARRPCSRKRCDGPGSCPMSPRRATERVAQQPNPTTPTARTRGHSALGPISTNQQRDDSVIVPNLVEAPTCTLKAVGLRCQSHPSWSVVQFRRNQSKRMDDHKLTSLRTTIPGLVFVT